MLKNISNHTCVLDQPWSKILSNLCLKAPWDLHNKMAWGDLHCSIPVRELLTKGWLEFCQALCQEFMHAREFLTWQNVHANGSANEQLMLNLFATTTHHWLPLLAIVCLCGNFWPCKHPVACIGIRLGKIYWFVSIYPYKHKQCGCIDRKSVHRLKI